jgi:hypothetical protein
MADRRREGRKHRQGEGSHMLSARPPPAHDEQDTEDQQSECRPYFGEMLHPRRRAVREVVDVFVHSLSARTFM